MAIRQYPTDAMKKMQVSNVLSFNMTRYSNNLRHNLFKFQCRTPFVLIGSSAPHTLEILSHGVPGKPLKRPPVRPTAPKLVPPRGGLREARSALSNATPVLTRRARSCPTSGVHPDEERRWATAWLGSIGRCTIRGRGMPRPISIRVRSAQSHQRKS